MPRPVWAVDHRDRDRKVYFSGRDNARRWLDNRDPDDYDIVPIDDEELKRLWRGKRRG